MTDLKNDGGFIVEKDQTVSTVPEIIENPNRELRPDLSEGPLSSLNHEQRVRVAALNMAKPLLVNKGLLGTTGEIDLGDLLRLATWILDGNDEPLYPFVSGTMLILGPDISVDVDGDLIHWKGDRYLKEFDDEN